MLLLHLQMIKMKLSSFIFLLLFIPHSSSYQPFFPSPSPSPSPPFSSTYHHFFPHTTTTTTTTPPSTSLPTFPANISSIILPPSSSSKRILVLSLTLSLLSVAFIAAVVASLLYHNHKPPSSDTLRLFPPNIPTSHDKPTSTNTTISYNTLGSPDLQPLPPLPRRNFPHHQGSSTHPDVDKFFSLIDNRGSDSSNVAYLASPTHTMFASPSIVLDLSSTCLPSKLSDPTVRFPAPVRLSKSPLTPSSPTQRYAHNTPEQNSDVHVQVKLPPPPPPMPPPGFWEAHVEVQEPTNGRVTEVHQE